MRAAPRDSVVGDLYVGSVSESSIVLIGDGRASDSRARSIQVTREYPIFLGDEGSFERDPLFRAAIPEARPLFAADVRFVPERSAIRVGRVSVLSASTSSVVQIGSNGTMTNESRSKEIIQAPPCEAGE